MREKNCAHRAVRHLNGCPATDASISMKRRQQLWLMLAAAASAEVVRLGYFGEAQPFQVACARGWFDTEDGGDILHCILVNVNHGDLSHFTYFLNHHVTR